MESGRRASVPEHLLEKVGPSIWDLAQEAKREFPHLPHSLIGVHESQAGGADIFPLGYGKRWTDLLFVPHTVSSAGKRLAEKHFNRWRTYITLQAIVDECYTVSLRRYELTQLHVYIVQLEDEDAYNWVVAPRDYLIEQLLLEEEKEMDGAP